MNLSNAIETSSNNPVAVPTAYPVPGTYSVTQRITLLCATPGAVIHYTMDGSAPTIASPAYDPYKLPVLEAINEGDRGLCIPYIIRAFAVKDGMGDSDVAEFAFTIDRRSKDVYISRQIAPGVYFILDFDDTKMVLVTGTKRALLIDAGLGKGDLQGYVESLIGDLPLDVVITHAHPDHVACMGQFQGKADVFMHHADLPLVKNFIQRMGYRINPEQIIDVREGRVYDLGDRQLRCYEVPGHTPGSIVLFDEANGLIFAGDALGSNRPTIVDALWMQNKGMAPIDRYLSTVQVFRKKVYGKFKALYTGHNDVPIVDEAYLDNLQQGAQLLVDRGDEVLLPSLRPTDVWQVVVGDRMLDPNWVAINVSKGSYLTATIEKLSTLSNLEVSTGTLSPAFTPTTFTYSVVVDSGVADIAISPTATSSRHRNLVVDGKPVISGVAHRIDIGQGKKQVSITVTSPDGSTTNTYTVSLHRVV